MALSDTRSLEDIPVQHRQVTEEYNVEAEHLMWARDARANVVLSLAWKNPVIVAYVNVADQYLGARRI